MTEGRLALARGMFPGLCSSCAVRELDAYCEVVEEDARVGRPPTVTPDGVMGPRPLCCLAAEVMES